MKDPKKMYNKNEAKSNAKKYLIILVCFLPFLILINFTVFLNLDAWLMILLDVILCFGVVFVVTYIINTVKKKKQEKQQMNGNNVTKVIKVNDDSNDKMNNNKK